MSIFQKIQKECKELSPKHKEEKCKRFIKDIENLQAKISSIKKQLVVQNKNQQLDQIVDLFIKLS